MNIDTFYHPKVTKGFLKDNHFFHSRGWSEEDAEAYLLTLPLYRYHTLSLLELRIVLYDDGATRIDVIDSATKGVYAPWYRHESYDRYPILKEIDTQITKIMTQMGFVERSQHNGRKSNQNRRRRDSKKAF